jgi:septal ring factor EnvC (AmiA/AmiB activator)
MNNKLIWAGLAGAALLVILVVVTAAYFNKSSQLTVMGNRAESIEKQAQQLQTKLTALEQKLEDREKTVKDLEDKNSQSELERERTLVKTQKLRENVATVGQCLKGALGLILAARREDYGQMRIILGAMEEPCNQSGKILENLEEPDSELARF